MKKKLKPLQRLREWHKAIENQSSSLDARVCQRQLCYSIYLSLTVNLTECVLDRWYLPLLRLHSKEAAVAWFPIAIPTYWPRFRQKPLLSPSSSRKWLASGSQWRQSAVEARSSGCFLLMWVVFLSVQCQVIGNCHLHRSSPYIACETLAGVTSY